MDEEVPRKRPQTNDSPTQSSGVDSLSPSKRCRCDPSHHINMHGRREQTCIPILITRENPSPSHHPNALEIDDDDDDDYTSSSGSSSSDNDDEDEGEEKDNEGEEEETTRGDGNGSHSTLGKGLNRVAAQDDTESIPHLSSKRKPRIGPVEKDKDLLSRLSAFLPQMKSANDALQMEIEAGRGKDIRLDDEESNNGDGQYIEMNLGLGVLEEKRLDGHQTDSDENSGCESDTREDNSSKQPNVLDRLMGKKEPSPSEKPSIEEMAD